MVMYFDDIPIYNYNKYEHLSHTRQILGILQEQKLYVNLKKCMILINEMVFLDTSSLLMALEPSKASPYLLPFMMWEVFLD